MHSRVRTVVAEILGIDPASFGDDTRRDEFESWDSMNHLRLVTAVESTFGVRLTMEEIEALQSPRNLEDLVRAKGGLDG
jgi:acyl carrier protein